MSLATLIEEWRKGDRTALSRLLTLAARGEHLTEIRAALGKRITEQEGGRAPTLPLSHSPTLTRVVAVTGAGGVGKSTLIGSLIGCFRQEQKRVAVLACDPESPLTGGALLGDRLRMPAGADDPGVFIRSLATPGGRQALAEHLDLMIGLLAAFGFDAVLLETVGAGQGDTAVRNLVDVVAVLLQPEAGDDVQWEKAGLLEVADVIIIHKADLPGADRTESQVRSLLNLPGCPEVPVLRVSSMQKTGLTELYRLLLELPSRRAARRRGAQALLQLVQELLAERFRERRQETESIVQAWRENALSDEQAVAALLEKLASRER